MNEKTKERLKRLDNDLITNLESNFSIKVFQDNVSEDELKNDLGGIYKYIIFETGGMRRPEEKKFTLIQDILVRFYAEGVDDLDGIQIDVISILESKGYFLVDSTKGSIQKGNEDSFVDAIEFNFTRSIKYVC